MPDASPDLSDSMKRLYALRDEAKARRAAAQNDTRAAALARLRALRESRRPPSEKIQEQNTVRSTIKTLKRADAALTSRGAASRRPFDLKYNPHSAPEDAVRNYLFRYSRGNLDLTKHPAPPSTGYKDRVAFSANYPVAHQIIKQVGKAQFDGILATTHHINRTPAVPSERLAAITDAAQFWLQAASSGRLLKAGERLTNLGQPGVGPPIDLSAASRWSMDEVQNTFAKVIDLPIKTLSEDPPANLSDREKQLLKDFGGTGGENFRAFYQRHEDYFVARRRWSSLLGRPVDHDPLKSGPISYDQARLIRLQKTTPDVAKDRLSWPDSIPSAAQAFRPDLLYEHSPHLKYSIDTGIVQAAGAAEDLAAQAAAGAEAYGTLLGPLSIEATRDMVYGGALSDTLSFTGGAFDVATLGVLSTTHKSLDDAYQWAGFKGGYRNVISSLSRGLISRTDPGVARQFELYEEILQNHPELSTEDAEELYRNLYSARNVVADTLAATQAGGGARGWTVEWMGDATRAALSDATGAAVDDPAGLTMAATLAGLAASARWAKAGDVLKALGKEPSLAARAGVYLKLGRNRLPRSLFSDLDASVVDKLGNPAFKALSAEDQAAVLRGLTDRLRDEITPQNAAVAKSAINGLRRFLDKKKLPLDPYTEGYLHAALDKASASLKRARRLKGGAAATELDAALEGISHVTGNLGFDAAIVQRGGVLNLNPNIPGLKSVRRWLEHVKSSGELDMTHPYASIIPEKKLRALADGALDELHRTNQGIKNSVRIDEILSDVEDILARQHGSNKASTARRLAQAERFAHEYNTLVAAEASRNWRISNAGETIPEANPSTKSALFGKVDRAISDPTDTHLRRLLWSEKGNPNRRIAQRIGGSELVRTLDTLRETEVRLANEAAKGKTPVSDAIRVRREAESLFRSHLESWHREQSRPIRRRTNPVPAAELPKHRALLESIVQKTDAATKSRTVVDLSAEELAWLNRQRKPRHRLGSRNDVYEIAKALQDDAKKYADAAQGTEKILAEIADVRKNLKDPTRAFSTPGQILPTATRKFVADLLGSEEAALFNQFRKFDSLLGAPTSAELTAAEAWAEVTKAFDEGLAAVEKGLTPSIGWMMAKLPKKLQFFALRDAINRGNGLHDAFSKQAKAIKYRYDRLSPNDQAALFEAARLGDKTPLSKAAAHVYDLNLHHRRALLDELHDAGAITDAQYQEYYAEDYVHLTYSNKGGRPVYAQPNFLPNRFKPLSLEANPFKFKRPEDSYWVSWKDSKGRIQHEKGFATPEEAAAWLDENVRAAEANVHAPVRYFQKLMEGADVEFGKSVLTMTQSLTRMLNNARIGKALAESGLTWTEADLVAAGAEFSKNNTIATLPYEAGVMQKFGKSYRLVRVDSDYVPALKGRWVDGRALGYLDQFSKDITWFKGLLDDATKEAGRGIMGPGYGIVESLGGKAIPTAIHKSFQSVSSLWSIKNILLGPPAYIAGWAGNIFFYSRQALAGTGVSWSRSMIRFPISMGSMLKEILDISRGKKPLSSSWVWKTLFERDHIREFDRVTFEDTLARHVDQNNKGAMGLWHKVTQAERELDRLRDAGDVEAAAQLRTHLNTLEQQLEVESRKSLAKNMNSISQTVRDYAVEGVKSLVGQGRFNQWAWNFYQYFTGDAPMKYHLLKEMVEYGGLTIDEASARLSAYTQHMHRMAKGSKEWLRSAGGSFIGGFRADQYRIWANMLGSNSPYIARDLALLASYNTTMLKAYGYNVEDYVRQYAAERNLDMGPAYLGALALNAMVPASISGREGLDVIGTGRITGSDLFETFGVSDDFVDRITDGSSGLTKAATSAAVAGIRGFVGGSPGVAMLESAVVGKDEKGDPIRSIGDLAGYFFRSSFVPSFAPWGGGGYHWNKIERATQTNVPPSERTGPAEISPATLQGIDAHDATVRALLKNRPAIDPNRFASAVFYDHLDKQGKKNQFLASMDYSEQRNTYVARWAGTGQGALDGPEAVKRNEEWYREHPQVADTLSGLATRPVDPAVKERALERSTLGTFWSNVDHSRVDDVIHTYVKWRHYAGDGRLYTKEIDQRFIDIINEKVQRPEFAELVKHINESLQRYSVDPRISPELKRQIRTWAEGMEWRKFTADMNALNRL